MTAFSGRITSIQPNVRLLRSFDQRTFEPAGYRIALDSGQLFLGIAEAKVAHFQLQVGVTVTGEYVTSQRHVPLAYEVTQIKVIGSSSPPKTKSPPFLGVPPSLQVYEERGCRRLSEKTYETKCSTCLWGAFMYVDMIIDHWNPSSRDDRDETFCYGPLKCRLYKAGPTRKVPGRRGMEYVEEDWVDEDAVGHREEAE